MKRPVYLCRVTWPSAVQAAIERARAADGVRSPCVELGLIEMAVGRPNRLDAAPGPARPPGRARRDAGPRGQPRRLVGSGGLRVTARDERRAPVSGIRNRRLVALKLGRIRLTSLGTAHERTWLARRAGRRRRPTLV